MKLHIKTKVSLGLTFLFIVVIILSTVSLFSIIHIGDETKTILKSDYESLEYAEKMKQSMDKYQMHDPIALPEFNENLKLLESKISEVGEKEVIAEIRTFEANLKTPDSSSSVINDIRQDLYILSNINMHGIVRKTNDVQQLADKAVLYFSILVVICFLASLSFILNFPGYIANPVKKLTEGIKQIAARNYSQRIYLKKGDEFGELADAFNIMAQKLDNYEHSNLAKIIFEKKRIDTIINNMKDPVIGFDENKNVLFANNSSIKILGITEQDLIGKYAPDVALNNDLLRNLIKDEDNKTPLKIYADEKESYFTKEVIKIIAESKSIGEVVMLKNITQFKEIDLAKTNFITSMSHGLKTPISSIMMSLKLLMDEKTGLTNPEQKLLIKHIKSDTRQLSAITTELLDLAEVESGNIQLEKQDIKPEAVINFACEALKFQAEEKKLKFDISCPTDLPLIHCDMQKTVWVMINLLSNAVRYSPENSAIIINAKREREGVTFSVTDYGKGIDPKYRDKVFTRFYKIPQNEPKKTSGTGLGLAISREFITAQGGEIWLEKDIEEGTVFRFYIPSSIKV